MSQSASIEDLKAMMQEIHLLFKETDAQFKETAVRFKETDAKFKETDAKFKETDAQFKETAVRFKETDARFKETDAQFKETDKKIKEAMNLFTGQWGKLVESLVSGDLVNLLRSRGIDVTDISQRRRGKKNGRQYEFDIVAINGHELVIVEVKTTLRVKDVKKHMERMEMVKEWIPEYADKKIYGAIAYLHEQERAALYAERQGFFVIKATGDSASIDNAADFRPKVF